MIPSGLRLKRFKVLGPIVAALGAALFSFLCLLCVGATLLIGAKLQAPDLGAGASPLSVLATIAIVALGGLGATVNIGEVEVAALPLGAVLFVGLGITWATRRALADGDRSRPAIGLAVGAWLAMLCAAAALAFRLGSGTDQTHVAALPAAVAGAFWGAIFAVWGLLAPIPRIKLGESARGAWNAAASFIGGKAFHARGRGTMSLTLSTALLSLGVTILIVVARLIAEPPSTILSAAGTLIHAAAFAANLAVCVAAVSLGATVEAGMGSLVSASAEVPGYSLLDWAGAAPPAYAWMLLAIPVASVLYAGAVLHRNRRFGVGSVVVSALAFASVLGGLAAFSDARVGLDLGAEGWARLSPDALQTFLLGLGWAIVGLPAGRAVAGLRERHSDPAASNTQG